MSKANVAAVMRALADPTRRVIFERIVKAQEITVVELTHGSGVSQSAVSQHLRSLRQAGLVVERKAGRNAHYQVQPEGLAPLIDWLGIYGVFWRDRFVRLRELLREIDP
jgi:DNA-binding transcriptional ArsR family regulator